MTLDTVMEGAVVLFEVAGVAILVAGTLLTLLSALRILRDGSRAAAYEAARRGVLASAGSACSAHDAEPSPALLALGLSEDEARTALRCTFGPDADAPLLDAAADAIVDAVRTVTALR